ncbi:MarR family winged helix-turn-helix transcriptional regulator [Saccharophagus degradans]|uniref:Regulatory protein, MarR n=2 Tax=Saccharophagus degradans TaxID=86304 RepID=Q21DT3_SACD2|nr:MarR family transcriptional regulator [Saccharophagus degradans]ABD83146.1 regulatory protein, MarR [Saccharophagus degradans 2-40]
MDDKKIGLLQRAVVNFMICHDLLTPQIDKQLRPLGLNLTQMSLLNHFSHAPQQRHTISQLVKVMGINQPGITKAVNALEKLACLQKQNDKDDARIKWLQITPYGLEKLNEARQTTGPLVFSAFGSVADQDLQSFCDGLEQMKVFLDRNRG